MPPSSDPAVPTVTPVTISYSELQDKDKDLSVKIEEGFGSNGLGILSITHVPGYSSLHGNLLRLSPRLSNLPEEVKKELEDPHSRYNFGWSHGKEKLESGKPDTLKARFMQIQYWIALRQMNLILNGIHHTVVQQYGPIVNCQN